MNAQTNVSSYTKALIDIVDAKDRNETGSFRIIDKFSADVQELYKRVDHARGIEGMSVRGVLLDHFYADPTAAKLGDRYRELVELRGISPTQKLEKLRIKRKIDNVVTLLTKLVDVFVSVNRLKDANFAVEFRAVPKTDAIVCRIRGPKDDDFAVFSEAQVLRLLKHSIDNLDSYAQLQDKSKVGNGDSKRKPGQQAESIAASNVARVAEGLDNAIAGLTFEKDGGLSPTAREKMMRLWAHLDSVLTDEQKRIAHAKFDADDADKDDEAAA